MEGFLVGRWVGAEQAQCKTQAEAREDHPGDHQEGHQEDRLEDLEPQEDRQMVDIKSRAEVLMFEGSLYEEHYPKTSEQ